MRPRRRSMCRGRLLSVTAGTPITNYEIQRSPATGTPTWTAVATVGNVTSTTATGLTGGSSYIFRVRAINVVGNGAWSAVVGERDYADGARRGDRCGGFECDRRRRLMCRGRLLSVTAATPITNYEIQRSPATGTPTWTAVATVGNVTSTTATGLTGGSSYIFRVRAINVVGNGAWSASSVELARGDGAWRGDRCGGFECDVDVD